MKLVLLNKGIDFDFYVKMEYLRNLLISFICFIGGFLI